MLCKFEESGGLEALRAASEAKLGFKPVSMEVDGALITSVDDIEPGDVIICSRSASTSPAPRATATGNEELVAPHAMCKFLFRLVSLAFLSWLFCAFAVPMFFEAPPLLEPPAPPPRTATMMDRVKLWGTFATLGLAFGQYVAAPVIEGILALIMPPGLYIPLRFVYLPYGGMRFLITTASYLDVCHLLEDNNFVDWNTQCVQLGGNL